jgi:hypothetical protein
MKRAARFSAPGWALAASAAQPQRCAFWRATDMATHSAPERMGCMDGAGTADLLMVRPEGGAGELE